jgi:hypothetical protein
LEKEIERSNRTGRPFCSAILMRQCNALSTCIQNILVPCRAYLHGLCSAISKDVSFLSHYPRCRKFALQQRETAKLKGLLDKDGLGMYCMLCDNYWKPSAAANTKVASLLSWKKLDKAYATFCLARTAHLATGEMSFPIVRVSN